jgi:LPS-assembly lipoprotein
MPYPRPNIRLCFALLVCVALSACGFQLRGVADLPSSWRQLHLAAADPQGELARELEGWLQSSGVQWGPRTDANYIIELSAEQFEQRSLSVGQQIRAAEFELVLSAQYAIYDRSGRALQSPTTASVSALVENDPQNIVGKTDEIRMLREELRGNLVQQIIRQISFAANAG